MGRRRPIFPVSGVKRLIQEEPSGRRMRKAVLSGFFDRWRTVEGKGYCAGESIAERCLTASRAAARALVAGFNVTPGSTLLPNWATRSQ